MNVQITDTTETRLGVYQVLARLWMSEVDERLFEGLKATEFPSTPETPELENAYRSLEAYLRDSPEEALTELTADYAVLCRSVDRHRGAHPYESVHTNHLGLMMQDEWEAVLRFYRDIGFERSESAIEPEDHLGIELECMARLCQRQLDASARDDEAASDEAIAQQRQLLEEHLLIWVPRFVEKVESMAKTDFYKAIASITNEYLKLDEGILRSS